MKAAKKVPLTTKNAVTNPEKDTNTVRKAQTKPKIFTFEEDSIEEHNTK